MKHNNRDKDILIALTIIILVLVLLISSFVHDIRRLHRNGLLIYTYHTKQTRA
jgi:hypothetical protein